jgi:nucleoside phosphorylase
MEGTTDVLRADVLLVTAVASEETALKSVALASGLRWDRRKGAAATYYHIGELRGRRVAALRLKSMGSFSATGSAFTCHRAMVESEATTILAVGIAFGISEEWQMVGDMLIAESLHLYDEADVIDDAETGYRYVYGPKATVPASAEWVERFRTAATTGAETPSGVARHHVGKMLAGGARIESRAFRELLRRRVEVDGTVVVGGEMEAAGIAAACSAAGADWAVVKAVADFATSESRATISETRDLAANTAALFTLKTLAAS